ncbi:sugar ABC transporter substrate-binding protein [Pseudomonas gingeri NCPPB 3146 = LMG 5327]|uniref:Polysaccharide export protein n=2 Tax=Pseudomonas gingeri TaxID=117681 RepID=A0A7Y7XTP1_9PSED|nr:MULTISPECIES: polysaccharide biosynthesis/export family protein [Pseudomonas]NWC12135.1 polysaccharide export protein [Pseudomonas gingeri]NWE46439.1 polysaccharide export protein [Pseudomonas gingeri]NWE67379.1 polysaccharide export protein [Pseudomonas gingeri]PNQ92921.1 sugar ABC transporter substrate-binding protein [Pseudomonas gingeri NCPPB 3146 = LMG 5327]BBP78380.1 sugar ABC transporter substrate-binding protein [Pseudomonas sp. Ost2]
MKNILLILSVFLLSACSIPAKVALPDGNILREGHRAGDALAGKPLPAQRIRAGDTLRIVRNTGEAPSISAFTANSIYELTLFTVMNDGSFAYPYIGNVKAAGLTPQQLTLVLEDKLKNIYQDSALTVNISTAPSNTVFVGGSVRNPASLPVTTVTTLEQALIGAGGLLPVGDSRNVALLRQEDDGRYKTYFFDYRDTMLAGVSNRPPVLLQRGDVVFVPKSHVGNGIEWVDLYLNQLIPFQKSIGIGVNYNLRDNNN